MTIRMVSLGDSFTEGMGDEWPDGQERGWADRVALGLALANPGTEVYYANLAIRGRLIEAIIAEQLDVALALDPAPTLVTFNGGGNDMLRPGFSMARVMELTSYVIDRCEAAGVDLLILTGADPVERMPGGSRFARLAGTWTDAVVDLVAPHPRTTFLDNFHDIETRKAPYWSVDRLHLSAFGHERIAARVLTALGYPTDMPDIADAPPPPAGLMAELLYWKTYVLPWIGRRLTGRSSGDGRSPKYSTWVKVTATRPWLP